MKFAIGSDHGGVRLKNLVVEWLQARGHEVHDLGVHESTSCDYPDFAKAVAGSVASGTSDRGVLVCGTGIGMSMTANKVAAIRAALCTDPYMAKMARAHNDANILVLGERVIGQGLAEEILDAFLTTDFEGGRHQRRVDKIMELDSPK